jgi:hypothetical protein
MFINRVLMVSICTVWYNFVQINSGVSSATAPRLTEHQWNTRDIVKLIEEWETDGRHKQYD